MVNFQGIQIELTRISGVMVSVLVSSVVDRVFEPRSDQIKDYKIGICCLSAKPAALRRKSGWFGMRITYSSGATCLPAERYFSELAL